MLERVVSSRRSAGKRGGPESGVKKDEAGRRTADLVRCCLYLSNQPIRKAGRQESEKTIKWKAAPWGWNLKNSRERSLVRRLKSIANWGPASWNRFTRTLYLSSCSDRDYTSPSKCLYLFIIGAKRSANIGWTFWWIPRSLSN